MLQKYFGKSCFYGNHVDKYFNCIIFKNALFKQRELFRGKKNERKMYSVFIAEEKLIYHTHFMVNTRI